MKEMPTMTIPPRARKERMVRDRTEVMRYHRGKRPNSRRIVLKKRQGRPLAEGARNRDLAPRVVVTPAIKTIPGDAATALLKNNSVSRTSQKHVEGVERDWVNVKFVASCWLSPHCSQY